MDTKTRKFKEALDDELATHLTKLSSRLYYSEAFEGLTAEVGLLITDRKVVSELHIQQGNPDVVGKAYGEEIRREFVYELRRVLDILEAIDTQKQERAWDEIQGNHGDR